MKLRQKSNKLVRSIFLAHQQWNHDSGWKNTLNNLRLIVQPLLLFWLVDPWLNIFPNSDLFLGFNHLINAMNQFKPFYASGEFCLFTIFSPRKVTEEG